MEAEQMSSEDEDEGLGEGQGLGEGEGIDQEPESESFFVAKITSKELIIVDEIDAAINDAGFEVLSYGWSYVREKPSFTKYVQIDATEEGVVNGPDGFLINPAFVTGIGQVGINDFVFMRKRGIGRFKFRFSLFPLTTRDVSVITYEIIYKAVQSPVSSVQCVGNQLLVTYETLT